MLSQPTEITVASGATLSDPFSIKSAVEVGVHIPSAITSCQIFLQAGLSVASADLVRAWKTDGSAVFSWDVGAASGGAALSLRDVAAPFPHGRLEMSAAQAAPRTFTILAKV